jgi:hypothetical protein
MLPNRPLLFVAVASVIAGMLVFAALREALFFLVFDLLEMSIPTGDIWGLIASVALRLVPLSFGMLTVFLITYWWCRNKS